ADDASVAGELVPGRPVVELRFHRDQLQPREGHVDQAKQDNLCFVERPERLVGGFQNPFSTSDFIAALISSSGVWPQSSAWTSASERRGRAGLRRVAAPVHR